MAADLSLVLRARDEASHVFGTVSKGASGLGTSIGNIASTAAGFVIGGAITALPGLLMDAAKGAAADEQATARLSTTVRSLGGDYDGTMAKVNNAISAGQKLAFTDDEVRDSFQFLAQATGSSDEALSRQTAAMDLARGANIPLGMATKMLGKMNDESAETFKKLGITIGSNATEAEALAAIQEKFGGQSKAYADSTAGQFEQAQIAMGEVVESLGAALLPVLATLGGVLVSVLPQLQEFATSLGEGIGTAVTTAMAMLAPFLPSIQEIGAQIAAAWNTVVQVFQGNWAPSDQIGPFVTAMGSIALVIRDVVIPAVTAVAGVIMDVLGAAIDWFVANWPLILQTVQTVFGPMVAFITEHSETIKTVFMAAWTVISTSIGTILKVLGGVIRAAMQVVNGDWSGAWETIKATGADVWAGIETIVGAGADAVTAVAADAWTTMTADSESGMTDMADAITAGNDGIAADQTSWWETWKADSAKVWGEVGDAIDLALTDIGASITEQWESFKTTISEKLTAIQAAIKSVWDLIPADIKADLEVIGAALVVSWNEFEASIATGMTAIQTAITTAWTAIQMAVGTALTTVGAAISDEWTTISGTATSMWAAITTVISTAWTAIQAAVDSFLAPIKASASAVWEGVKAAAVEKLDAARAFVEGWGSTISGVIRGWIGSVRSAASSVGEGIVDGIRQGVSAAWGGLTGWLGNMISGLAVLARAKLEEHSPSELFAREVGQPISQGIQLGVERGMPALHSTIASMVPAPNLGGGSFGAPTSGAPTSGGGSITINVNAPVYGVRDMENVIVRALASAGRRGRVSTAVLGHVAV